MANDNDRCPRTIWCNREEWCWLKKQLEIYRARQILKEETVKDSSTEEQRRSRAPQDSSYE